MTRLLQFALFFFVLVTLFGGFQYYLFRAYQRWIKASFPADRHAFWKRTARHTLIAGNVLFVLQFVSRSMGWHLSILGQVFIVLPSAFYIASVVTGFVLVLLNDLRRFLVFSFSHAMSALNGISRSASTSYAPPPSEAVNEGRRMFLRAGGAGILAAAVGTPLLASL